MNRKDNISASELFPEGEPSEARQLGRRLILRFLSRDMPELDRIEFHANGSSPKFEYLQKENDLDPTRGFRAGGVTIALPIFFLDYLCARLQKPPRPYHLEGGDGSLAATLGNALSDTDGAWRRLFTEYAPNGGRIKRYKTVFGGTNHHGKSTGQRIISVKADYLPPDCIEVFWNEEPLNGLEQIQRLTDQFRKAWKLPPPVKLDLPEGKGIKKEPQPAQPPPKKPTPQPEKGPEPKSTRSSPTPEPQPANWGWVFYQKPTPEPMPPKADAAFEGTAFEFKSASKPEQPKIQPAPPPKKIDPRLFEIQNPAGHTWDDFEVLLNFGRDDSEADTWRIRDACEGVAVFGAVGSGKTSGSGAAIARTFLQAGFGGLVLTAKPDEAGRWQRMCEETGRAADFIHVTTTSGHKLNFLQYETQRPGKRISVTDDLIALFRTLIGVMSRGKHSSTNDGFWTSAPDQLMRKLFEVFLLSGEPILLNRLIRFIHNAPKGEYFADIMARAEANALKEGGAAGETYLGLFEYWTRSFPETPEITRGGIIATFEAMADVLTGSGIREMIGTETNLTPETILSGKVVVLDIPLKGNIAGGLMVQAIWKVLFQQAVERRADKGLPTARPAFLWEDEAHLFFSQHDADFQPTARDVRAPHVMLSQNLQNFYKEGHNQHAVDAVFAAMNTLLFHTNGEMMTNRWASEKIGHIRKRKLTTDGLFKALRNKDITFSARRPEEVENVGSMTVVEENKPAMPPEAFASLKRGGDGICEAVLIWLSHQFAFNGGRNFCVLQFAQEPRNT